MVTHKILSNESIKDELVVWHLKFLCKNAGCKQTKNSNSSSEF